MEDAIARAKAIAAKLSASVQANEGQAMKRKQEFDHDSRPRVAANGPSNNMRKKIYIPASKHPEINYLGPRGSAAKEREQRTGAKILIRGRGSQKNDEPAFGDDANDDLHVIVEGSPESVAKACIELNSIFNNPDVALKIKEDQMSHISSGGSAGGGSHYGPGRDMSSALTVAGSNMSSALTTMGGLSESSAGILTKEIKVPNQFVGLIIGKGGENIQKMQFSLNIQIQIAKESDMRPGESDRRILLRATNEMNLSLAEEKIREIINERLSKLGGRGQSRPDLPFSIEVIVPNNHVGLIIGKSGATIRTIQDSRQVNIQIPPQPDEDNPTVRTIWIGGRTRASIEQSRDEIYEILGQHSVEKQAMAAYDDYSVNPSLNMSSSSSVDANSFLGPIMSLTVPSSTSHVMTDHLNSIMSRTGCRIEILSHADSSTLLKVNFAGEVPSCEAARYDIEVIVGSATHVSDNLEYASAWSKYYKDVAAASIASATQDQVVMNVSLEEKDKYRESFLQYVAHYGEEYARQMFGAYAPDVVEEESKNDFNDDDHKRPRIEK